VRLPPAPLEAGAHWRDTRGCEDAMTGGYIKQRNDGYYVADIRDVIDAILLVWSASLPADWANQMHHLPWLARHIFND
jgi:hypothetical protein